MQDLKILIVEDSLSSRKLLLRALYKIGFGEIVEAVDGVDALEKLEFDTFDLIITDCYMPKMSGLELVMK